MLNHYCDLHRLYTLLKKQLYLPFAGECLRHIRESEIVYTPGFASRTDHMYDIYRTCYRIQCETKCRSVEGYEAVLARLQQHDDDEEVWLSSIAVQDVSYVVVCCARKQRLIGVLRSSCDSPLRMLQDIGPSVRRGLCAGSERYVGMVRQSGLCA